LNVVVCHVESEVARPLLEAGCQPKYKSGFLALKWAVIMGHVEIVRLLLEAHVDIESRDTNSRTLLISAARQGPLDAAELLLRSGQMSTREMTMTEHRYVGRPKMGIWR